MALKLGKDVKVKIDLNGVGGAGANWSTIGQQRGGSDTIGNDTVDGTTKDSAGWVESVIVHKNWSVSIDGALDPADAGLSYLRTQLKAGAKVYVQIDATVAGGIKEEGRSIGNMTRDHPEGDLVSFSAEFTGDGALTTSP